MCWAVAAAAAAVAGVAIDAGGEHLSSAVRWCACVRLIFEKMGKLRVYASEPQRAGAEEDE